MFFSGGMVMRILFYILWFLTLIGGLVANSLFGNGASIPYLIGFIAGTFSFAFLRLAKTW